MVDISSLGRSNRQSRDTFSTHDAGFVVAPDTGSLTHLREQTQIQWLTRSLNNRAANDPQGFGQALELALGPRADRSTINSLIDSAIAGDLPLPNTRFVDEGALGNGALGAYDPRNGGTILLDRSLLTDDAAMERVFLEEAGHHLDAQAGAGDATGDEGAIFARSLLGESLTGTQMNSLRAENDHGTVQLDGKLVEVEFHFGSDTPGGSVDGIGGRESNTGSSSNDSYSDNDHSNETYRTKPPAESPAPAQTGGYDEVGINVPAPPPTPAPDRSIDNDPAPELPAPAPTDGPHGYDEVGIDVPAPAEDKPPTEDDDVAAGAAIAIPAAVATRPGFWGGVGRGLAGLFSFFGLGTATTGVGLAGALWPSPTGGRPQTHAIAGTDATIQINPDTLQGTVHVNGVETTISVIATTVDINGNPAGFAPATPMDAENLSTLGVDISDPSGVIDTSPLNSENTSEGNGVETQIEPKIEAQMGQRGWDEELLDDTIENPAKTHEARDTRWNSDGTRRDDPATAYVDDEGHYVVRNDVNGTVVQVSDRNDPNWQAPWD